MFKKILCMALAFAITLTVFAEDLHSVIEYYRPEMSQGFIYISKVDMTLTLVNSQGDSVITYPIACGRNVGQKTTRGDLKTPEGHFLLQKIHDASSWGHDFHDGKGFIRHAYGPYFLRLKTGFQGIGIHGTHAPESIGTRATEGCIRLDNKDIADLEPRVNLGMPVIIGPEQGVEQLIAGDVPRPEGPTWLVPSAASKGEVVEPIQVDHKLLVVDGLIDIDTERDLVDIEVPTVPTVEPKLVMPETAAPEVSVPATEVAESVPVVNEPVTVEPENVVIEEPVAQPEVTTPETETSETPVTESAVTESVPAEPSTQSEAPKYEVVVEEVTQPDGTTKFEVRYKRIN